MVIGVCHLDLLIRENNSLKGKRRILKKIIERVKNKFNVSIAEVGNHDLWQSSQVGFCVVGNDKRFINSSLDKIIRFIEDLNSAEIVKSEIELLNF
ncbi:MAG: DUF503 domain-containing protein [Deltaproteobacteria bacterium]|jgi:hypothetical protein|nr:DUF503 domain-containing protein [Deltaproteobacteria bacterium]